MPNAAPKKEAPSLFEVEAPQTYEATVNLQFLTPTEELHAPLDPGMVESLRRFGMLSPIGCQDKGNDAPFQVLDGARRVVAARHLQSLLDPETLKRLHLDPVRAIFVPEEYSSAEAITLLQNYQRSPNPARDFLALETALKRPGATPKGIAMELGLEERELGRLAKLLSLNEALKAAFLAGELAPGLALRIAKMSQDRQERIAAYRAKKHAEAVAAGKKPSLTGKEVDALFKRDAQAAIAALGDEVFLPGTTLPGMAQATLEDLDPFEFPPDPPGDLFQADLPVLSSEGAAELSLLKLELENALVERDHWKTCAAARAEAMNDLHASLAKSEKKMEQMMGMAQGMVAGIAKEIRKKADAKYPKADLIGAMLQAASSLEKLK